MNLLKITSGFYMIAKKKCGKGREEYELALMIVKVVVLNSQQYKKRY